MKILAFELENSGADRNKFKSIADDEARKAWKLYQEGWVRELYFRADSTTADLVLECDSLPAAEEILASLPFVRDGLIRFELTPLKAYPGFERLFVKLDREEEKCLEPD
jgi:muconolactone delta-isomerase